MLEIEYLTDKNRKPKAVVIPIELGQQIMPRLQETIEDLSESMENYCLNQAMNEAKGTPLLNRKAALEFLETEFES